ncbi:MAG: aminoglycoside phosphotransferase family protein [Gammaproteobacteria bacterium]|nr:aminoglycoside phosphotransferase family protein [Gammaproteobacteria bacterium]
MREWTEAPEITGPLDGDYLAAALKRARRQCALAGELELTPLTAGRTGARVTAVRGGSGPGYVVKAIPANRGMAEGAGSAGEWAFWQTGLSRDLPAPIVNPTIDVAHHVGNDEWWLLMEDVSAGIRSRSQWREEHTRRLFEAIAGLHARHWGGDDDTPACTLSGTTGAFVETALYVATGTASAPWVERAAEEFPVPRMLLPAFLEALAPGEAEFFIGLCRRWPDIVAALERHPLTLIHGDLRRANISFAGNEIALIDWEFLARAPAAVDLTWHWFMHYWAYPPADGKAEEDRLWLREAYLERLETLLGAPLDREGFRVAWELGWLRMFCQLAFLLADPLTSDDLSGDEAGRARRLCRDAVTRARRIVDAHVR